ncbi:MAG: hypothetical protein WEC59_09165 [Salibacteraceae bacterium]
MNRDQNATSKELGLAILKGSIGAIPYAGSLLNEVLFEVRGRLKQNRINSFVESLSNYMESLDPNRLNLNQIRNEDFGDFFEELLISVSKTRSTSKHHAFRNLLVNQLMNTTKIDTTEIFLELLKSITEKQIAILSLIEPDYESGYTEILGERLIIKRELESLNGEMRENYGFMNYEDVAGDRGFKDLDGKISTLKGDLEKIEDEIKENQKLYLPKTYNISSSEFAYLKQDLISKGLLQDKGMKYSAEPLELVEITPLGVDLLNYIKDTDP